MTLVTLLVAQPWAISTGTQATLRLAGGGSRGYDHLSSTAWKAGISDRPLFKSEIGFDQSGWNGAAIPTSGTFRFIPPAGTFADLLLDDYFWLNAPITIYTGDDASASPSFTTELTGTVANVTSAEGALVITVADFGADLNRPLLSTRYLGTGGIEGGAEAAGNIKRRNFGKVWNVEGRVLDKTNNIYEFGDINQPIQGFVDVKDMGRAGSPSSGIAWAGSVLATLNALKASTPTAGGYIVANSIGCVKWWTVPNKITADLLGEIGTGYVETAPLIAERIATLFPSSAITVTNAAAMSTARSGQAGIHIKDEGETIANAIDRLLLPATLTWVINPAGTMTFREFTFASPVETIQASAIARKEVYQPIKTRRVGYQRNETVHTAGEVSAVLFGAIVTLSKPAAQVPADAAGTVSSFASATGNMRIILVDGTSVVADTTFSVVTQTNVTGSINSSGVYSVTAMSADTGELVVRAAYGGINYDRAFVVTKAKTGTAGANAKTVIVFADRQSVVYNGQGAPFPSTQTTTFYVNKQNTTGTVNWLVFDAAGNAKTPTTTYLSAATGDSVTMTEAQFAAARGNTNGVSVQGSITDGSTFTDIASLTRTIGTMPGASSVKFAPTLAALVDNHKIVATNGTPGWGNSGAASIEGFKDAAEVFWRVDLANQGYMVGLDQVPAVDSNYTSIDAAIYVQSGVAQAYESGAIAGSSIAVQTGDILAVAVSLNGDVHYKKNNNDFHTHFWATGLTLYADVAIFTGGTTIDDINMWNYGSGSSAAVLALNADGTIKNDKVLTPSIIDDGVTGYFYVESSTTIGFTGLNGTKYQIFTLNFTKVLGTESVIKVTSPLNFLSVDSVDGELSVALEPSGGGTAIATKAYQINADCNGTTFILQTAMAAFTGISAGSYTMRVYFEKNGNSSQVQNHRFLEVVEQKK